MKSLWLCLALTFFPLSGSFAATITGNVSDSTSIVEPGGAEVSFEPKDTPWLSGPNLTTSRYVKTYSDTDGNWSISLKQGEYEWMVGGERLGLVRIPDSTATIPVNQVTATFVYLGSAFDLGKVKVSGTDTNSNFLASKVVAGANITVSTTGTGADEKVSISASGAISGTVDAANIVSGTLSTNRLPGYLPGWSLLAPSAKQDAFSLATGVNVTLTTNGSVVTISSPTAGGGSGSLTNVGITTTLGLSASGSPLAGGGGTIALSPANDLAALEALSGTGLAARIGSETWATRLLVPGSTKITISNGNGVSGNPTIDVDSTQLDISTMVGVLQGPHMQGNSAAAAGIVPASGGHISQYYKTDGSGVPAWLDAPPSISGTFTTGTVPVANGSGSLFDSPITITDSNTASVQNLVVRGTFTMAGATTGLISTGVIIATNQLQALNATANRALVTDSGSNVTNSPTTATELGYVGGSTGPIQTQINGKQASFTTGVGVTNQSGVLSANLAAGSNVTLTTNSNGQVSIAASGGGALLSDTAYASSWNGVTDTAPTKNAVYDIIHAFDTDDDGKVNVLDTGAGLVKTDSGGVVGTAVSGTDYAPATSGSAILKGNGSGGFSSAASGTDYAPATSGSAVLKGNGSGGFSSAASGTDYAPATSGSAMLKANGSGGFANAASGTDYAPATSGSAILKGNGSGAFASATAGTDYAAAYTTGAGVTNQSGVLSANLAAGSNVTLTTNSNGQVSIAASGGGGTGNVVSTGSSTSTKYAKFTGTDGVSVAPATITLASSDFANQGTTTTVVHGAASGNPSFGAIVNADIASATIDLTAKVTGLLPVANGGTAASTAAGARTSLGAVNIAGDTMSGTLLVTGMTNNALTVGRALVAGAGKTEVSSVVGMSFPLCVEKPSVIPSSPGASVDTSGNRPLLTFNQLDIAKFTFTAPANYNGNLSIDLMYVMASATSGSVGWSIEVWPQNSGDSADSNTENYATANTGTSTVPGTAGFPKKLTITCSNVGTLTSGSVVTLKFKRTSDGLSGTASLTGILVNGDVK